MHRWSFSRHPTCSATCGSVAEWLEWWTCNQQVAGSNPSLNTVDEPWASGLRTCAFAIKQYTSQRVVMPCWCLHGQAPDYLSELCVPVTGQQLCSASRNLLVAPRFQLYTYGRRAFAMAAPATWNSLSDDLRNPDLHSATFRFNLKRFCFNNIWCIEHIRGAERLCAISIYIYITSHWLRITDISGSPPTGSRPM